MYMKKKYTQVVTKVNDHKDKQSLELLKSKWHKQQNCTNYITKQALP